MKIKQLNAQCSSYGRIVVPVLVGILVFLFWWLWHPELLNFHEQNQLFLLSGAYLTERLSVAGGLADWLSEAIVACYALPWLGALLLALLFVAIVATVTGALCSSVMLVGLVPAALLLWLLGDINVLLSYPVALLLVLVAFNVLRRAHLLWDLLALPVLYWAVGPLAWLYVALRIVSMFLARHHQTDKTTNQQTTQPTNHPTGKPTNQQTNKPTNQQTKRWPVLLEPLFLLALQLLAYRFILTQWPLQEVLLGLNYYRIPLQGNWLMAVIPAVIVLMPAVCGVDNATRPTANAAPMNATPMGMKFAVGHSRLTKTAAASRPAAVHRPATVAASPASAARSLAAALLALVLTVCAVHFGYNRDICETLRQDMLIRQQQWQKVIQRAEHYQPHTAFSSNCVNLALAMTRQLADRQFTFWQSGDDALLSPSIRDNVSDLPTMEAFYQLGLVNSALRYAHDIEESILNYRKSGRLEQRIVECNVIDGRYDLARKHLDLLKQSPFYRSWALDMEQTMQKEAFIMASPLGDIRQRRFKHDFLFSYDEVDKVLGQLFVNNPQNKMALDYFMGAMLLRGNIQGFVQYMGWVQQYGGYAQVPIGYQDALRAIQSHGEAPGSYSNYVKQMMNHHEEN